MNNTQLSEELENYLDQYFPKGNKNRGKAIALICHAFLDGYKQGKEEAEGKP